MKVFHEPNHSCLSHEMAHYVINLGVANGRHEPPLGLTKEPLQHKKCKNRILFCSQYKHMNVLQHTRDERNLFFKPH